MAPDNAIVCVSALTGAGCEDLTDQLGEKLTEDSAVYTFVLPAADGQRIAFLHARGEVLSEEMAGERAEGPELRIQVRMSEREFGRYSAL